MMQVTGSLDLVQLRVNLYVVHNDGATDNHEVMAGFVVEGMRTHVELLSA